MEYAIECAQKWNLATAIRSIQLNVADTNLRASAFFRKMGFVVVEPLDGTYPKGQRSIRMARPLTISSSAQ
jgi:ribosomal protein S18 acetylase RimI-like enzyme